MVIGTSGCKPLTPAEREAARRYLSGTAPRDTSADGRFVARPQKDAVILSETATGRERYIPAPNCDVHEAAVADDGSQVAFPSTCDVRLADSRGVRTVATLPHWADHVEYLPGGRLLAEASFDPWGSGRVPILYVLEQSGRCDVVGDVKEAEALGAHVRAPLLEEYRHSYPGATAAQCDDLLNRFGYDTPTFRVMSPDRKRMVFDVQDRVAPLPGNAGTWLLELGGAAPRRIDDPSLGTRHLSGAVWSPAGRRVATVMSADGADPMLAIAEADGSRVRALPLRFVRRPDAEPVAWSADDRYAAFEVANGDDSTVYCYDAQTDQYYPILPRAHVEGWDGARLRARMADGTVVRVDPRPLPAEQSAGLVLGGKDLPRPAGEIHVGEDHVDINGVRVPRRQS